MSKLVADHILERLSEWGVRRIYGYPGDGINGIIGALDRAVRPPSSSRRATRRWPRFMACAHAKFTGEVGRLPGHLAAPVRSTCSTASTTPRWTTSRWSRSSGSRRAAAMGGHYQQEVDLQNLFKDVASEYVPDASAPRRRSATASTGPSASPGPSAPSRASSCPKTCRMEPAGETPPQHTTRSTPASASRRRASSPTRTICAARPTILNAGERVAMLVGAGALNAADEVTEVAELLGAGVAKALLGKAVLPDDAAVRDRRHRPAGHAGRAGT